jgi:predicted Zn finger-like uncharacterized protein
MYSQCPECLTLYRLRAEQLAQGRGRARCGSCGAEFDLLPCLTDELPAPPFTTLKRRSGHAPLPLLDVPAGRPQSEQRELFVEFDPTLRAQRPAPSFARAAPTPARRVPVRDGGWRLGSALLLITLLGQWAWLERDLLLRNAMFASAAAGACAWLGCELPALADRRAIALTARDVRPHPSAPNALIISATIANQSELRQSFPLVEITLSDLEERRIAMRRFAPHEYVGDRSAIARGLPPGASATLSLEVEDPGRDAVAFEFRFL